MNAEFQRLQRRDNKAFLNEQSKDIKESNRKGKARNLFKTIGDIEGPFHAKIGIIKDKNGKDLTEAEEIKKRRQGYMEELYRKVLITRITMMVWSFTWSQTFPNVKSSGP